MVDYYQLNIDFSEGNVMDWQDNPEQAAFRSQVKDVIENGLPEAYKEIGGDWVQDRKSDDPAIRQRAVDWQGVLAERGWVAPHWPSEYGGAGLSGAGEGAGAPCWQYGGDGCCGIRDCRA